MFRSFIQCCCSQPFSTGPPLVYKKIHLNLQRCSVLVEPTWHLERLTFSVSLLVAADLLKPSVVRTSEFSVQLWLLSGPRPQQKNLSHNQDVVKRSTVAVLSDQQWMIFLHSDPKCSRCLWLELHICTAQGTPIAVVCSSSHCATWSVTLHELSWSFTSTDAALVKTLLSTDVWVFVWKHQLTCLCAPDVLSPRAVLAC